MWAGMKLLQSSWPADACQMRHTHGVFVSKLARVRHQVSNGTDIAEGGPPALSASLTSKALRPRDLATRFLSGLSVGLMRITAACQVRKST